MKLMKQYNDFNPIALVLESEEELGALWGIVEHAALTVENDALYKMACDISNWLTENVG